MSSWLSAASPACEQTHAIHAPQHPFLSAVTSVPTNMLTLFPCLQRLYLALAGCWKKAWLQKVRERWFNPFQPRYPLKRHQRDFPGESYDLQESQIAQEANGRQTCSSCKQTHVEPYPLEINRAFS